MGSRGSRQAPALLRPGEDRAIGVRGVGGGHDSNGGGIVPGDLAQGSEPVERPGIRELRPAQARDEVAAADAALVLQCRENRVETGKAPGNSLEGNGITGENPMAEEQLPGEGRQPLGR